ncbi:hypothetical protein [Paenibacillus montanisoli]|uniref:Heparinase n=1 Tax=Paenibacillus montanisoli TaxID=2081970 RepID=A0A328TT66_9BACL|nr:hypothetical protein [Paenibacillus montanisoli]RAP73747.1 hypothetical protein DL346_26170 [Paenibacillus montanisoli]
MNMTTDHCWQERWERFSSKQRLEEGLVNIGKPGHTLEGSKVKEAHDGRAAAGYYAFGTAVGRLTESQGLQILQSLAELQITDKTSPHYGAFRWYREETRVHDSNAAFFILLPLVVLRTFLEEQVPASHQQMMDRMFEHSAAWFEHELKEPIFYYSNKIVSDGAILLAISKLRSLPQQLQASLAFFERWLDYTERRGWGWGENISLIYIQVTMNALQLANVSLSAENDRLKERIGTVMNGLIDYVRFHDGYEFVPTIRSYQVAGEVHPSSFMWTLAGVQTAQSTTEWDYLSYLLFEEELAKENEGATLKVPRSRVERIMDSSYAHTWIGTTGRMGSVNRFPVVAGSYQWPTWGLAWQSYPVSLAVEGHQVSYLRWYAHDGEQVRTHPAAYEKAYLGPALFKEAWYPDTQLRSMQHNQALLVVRSMSRLHNEASELADEWVVNRWTGERCTFAGADGREWTILRYPNSAVLVTPLLGIAYGHSSRHAPVLQPIMDGDTLRLRQVLYAGDKQLLQQPRLETGWAIYYADGISSQDEATALAARLRLVESSYKDGEVPRDTYTELRSSRLYRDEEQLAELIIDPHKLESGEM